ncbi:MAG: TetR family transcriptional regulator C-terminal domain-containing protein, partial [Pseudomonadota bacterium]
SVVLGTVRGSDRDAMGKEDTRAKLLKAGESAFWEKGFHDAGIQEILKAAGVPKGSFYYYFKSKEDFGIQVVEAYAQFYDERIDPILADATRSPLERLRAVFEFLIADFVERGLRYGCLIGNLSQEMADRSDPFRECLDEIMASWHRSFTDCLLEARAAGEFSERWDAAKLASFCLNGWEGAMLRAKIVKSAAPLEDFLEIMFEILRTDRPSAVATS